VHRENGARLDVAAGRKTALREPHKKAGSIGPTPARRSVAIINVEFSYLYFCGMMFHETVLIFEGKIVGW
jgi:hypothetical protein